MGTFSFTVTYTLLRICTRMHTRHCSDIKSHNWLCDEWCRVKLCDFGLARTEEYVVSSSGVSRPPQQQQVEQHQHQHQQPHHTPCGTPAYMAPELWQGQAPTSQHSDVYALGVCLNELWSRDVPWDGVDTQEIRQRVQLPRGSSSAGSSNINSSSSSSSSNSGGGCGERPVHGDSVSRDWRQVSCLRCFLFCNLCFTLCFLLFCYIRLYSSPLLRHHRS
jgi:serine/threonine protein kinase